LNSTTVTVDAARRWNASGVTVRRGEVYAIEVPPGQKWHDASTEHGPEGDEVDRLKNWVWLRRRRDQPWFALIGAVGKRDPFPVRGGIPEWTAPADGELFFYANDVWFMYWNNGGSINVIVRRVR
jgi:hypothetical protein